MVELLPLARPACALDDDRPVIASVNAAGAAKRNALKPPNPAVSLYSRFTRGG
jgi:hypothetical protein